MVSFGGGDGGLGAGLGLGLDAVAIRQAPYFDGFGDVDLIPVEGLPVLIL